MNIIIILYGSFQINTTRTFYLYYTHSFRQSVFYYWHINKANISGRPFCVCTKQTILIGNHCFVWSWNIHPFNKGYVYINLYRRFGFKIISFKLKHQHCFVWSIETLFNFLEYCCFFSQSIWYNSKLLCTCIKTCFLVPKILFSSQRLSKFQGCSVYYCACGDINTIRPIKSNIA